MTLAEIWSLLGIEPTDDKRAVKLAYTQRLKETDVDSDPAAFVRLRAALEEALYWGTSKPDWEGEDYEQGLEQWAEGTGFTIEFSSAPEEEWASRDEWRPAPPIKKEGRLSEACAELDHLLFADEEPEPGRIVALGDEILSDPEMVNVDRAAETEQWLAQLIAAAAPRSDPLVEPAIARLAWHHSRRHWRHDYDAEQVLGRRDAIRFLVQCEKVQAQRVALRELRRPARSRLEWDNLSLARDVRDFLALVDSTHPSVHRDLNPDAVAWWRDYLRRPHLPASFWPLLLTIPLAISLFGAIVSAGLGGNAAMAILLYPAAMLATYGGIILVSHIRAKARERADQYWLAEQRSRGSSWIVLTGLVLPLAVAVAAAPARNAVAVAATALGLLALAVIIWWNLGRGWMILAPRSRFMPALAAVCSLAALAAMPADMVVKLLFPLMILCALGYWGYESVHLSMLDRGPRMAAVAAAFVLALLASVLAGRGLAAWPPAPWVLVLPPVAMVSAHLATSASLAHPNEWLFRVGGISFYFISRVFVDFLPALLLGLWVYGLGYSIVKLGHALVETARAPRPDPA